MKDLPINMKGSSDADSASLGFLKLDLEKIKINTDSIKDHYDVEHSPFARGKFATVRKCTHKETGIDYAAKFIRKRRRAVDVRHEILHEIAVLELAQPSPHIVNLKDVYETNSELILVLELVAGGELQRIIDEEEIIDEEIVVRLMKQILEGVAFLHENNIAHLDIKPQNLLLTAPFPNCSVKLCDFGISRLICGDVEIREIVGTPDYIAPEVLHYEPISVETDLWSIGILAYVLLSGHSPFGGDTKQETFCNITQSALDFPQEIFCNISSKAKDFIKSVLVRDPKLRPSVKECMTHSWLRSNDIDRSHSSSSCPVSPIPCVLSDQSSSETDEVDAVEAMSSETSSMDSSIPDGNDSCSEEQTTLVEDSSSVSSEMDTVKKLSKDNSPIKETECTNGISKSNSNSSITREVFNISSEKPKSIDSSPILTNELENPHRSQETNNSGHRSERLRGVFSLRNDSPNSSLLNHSFHDDNKENIRLIRTRVAPPPIIHSLTPSLNVRSGIVRNAITGFTSGRSMSTISPGKSLTSLLSPPKTRTNSVSSKSSTFSSTFSSLSSKSSLSSRKIRISSDETELRISKTSVVVIDEGVCF